MTELQYREIPCQKSVNGANFTAGVQDFNFSVGRPSAFIPSRCYFRVSMKLTGVGGLAQPTQKEQLAFADSACGNLYDNIYARFAGQDTSVATNFVAQTQALKTRLQKSGAWVNTIGKSACLNEADFQTRVNQVSSGDDNQLDEFTQVSVGTAAAINTATIAIAAASGVAAGVNTLFTTLAPVGSIIVVNGARYTVVANAADNVAITLNPKPSVDIAATTDVYVLKRVKRPEANRNEIFAIWKPPIGFFDHEDVMGPGDYRISLNPNSQYKQACVETLRGTFALPLTTPTNYDLEILDVKLYVAYVKQDIPAGISTMYFMESLVQAKPAIATTGQYEFTVPSSTRALTVFVQSGRAGSNPLMPPSMFKCLPDAAVPGGTERNLTSLQITYANTTKPSTRWGSKFDAGTNQMQQRYYDTLAESGLLDSSGGAESLEEFLERGPIYHYSFARDAEDRSTQVQVSTTFEGGLEAGANVFLVSWYSRAVEITTNNGRIEAVRTLSI